MQSTKADLDWGNLSFAYVQTDYNLRSHFTSSSKSWSTPELSSEVTVPIHIAAPSLHYGQQAFEGLKAFTTRDGRVVVFRPDENSKRMNFTADRIIMPRIPEEMFIDCVKKVVSANRRFVPPYGTGASLYIRPLLVGMGAKVGLGPAPDYMFLILVTPVGPYYKGGFKPVESLVVENYDRAAPHGVGDCKVGGNYAAGLPGSEFVHEKGYAVGLYVDPKEHKYIDEFSTSNFIAIKGNSYVTPDSPSILKSITNKTLVRIAEMNGMKIERRAIPVEELSEFDEVGAVGTAAVITPVSRVRFRERDFTFGSPEKAGPVLTKLYQQYTQIQTGDAPDTEGWLVTVE